MKQSTYWVVTLALFFGAVVLGFVGVSAGSFAVYNAFYIVAMWIAGYQRLEYRGTKGAHKLWAIFTPTVLGWIWIGCVKDKHDAPVS